ncbi:MAG: Mur ligase family protein, partial [Chloroherpetonaceae bacterium]|nr:Mur ligase family protein [Chloroherpetonaceae bacterium]
MDYTILGAGNSGINAALLAKELGYRVFVTEAKPLAEAHEAAQTFDRHAIASEFGGHTDKGLQADIIITSPGIPPSHPFLQEAARRGIPIISEVEFAWRHINPEQNPVIAITGTNGKTTTTALIAHILNSSGKKAI